MRRPGRHCLSCLALLGGLTGCQGIPLQVASQPSAMQAAEVVHGGTLTGDIRRHAAFASKLLGNARDLWIYLPPGYAQQTSTRFPVVYAHDGNNLFDARTAFMGREWQLDETAQRMITSGEVPPFILVGVSNTPARLDEYTWQPSEVDGQRQGGRGALYARFLIEELKPFIDRTYRTLPDRAHTAVMGSSLGGLISLYLGRFHGDTFGELAAMSPSVWWDDRAVIKDMDGLAASERLWVDIGTQEGDDPAASLEDARALHRHLLDLGFADGRDLGYEEDPGAQHDELAWARRAPDVLRFLLAPTR